MDYKEYFRKENEKIVAGLERVYEKLIAAKRQQNRSLVFSEDGRIIRVSAFEMPERISHGGKDSSASH